MNGMSFYRIFGIFASLMANIEIEVRHIYALNISQNRN